MPFWQNKGGSSTTTAISSSTSLTGGENHVSGHLRQSSVSSVARSLLPTRRRLKLDPSNKLYFPYEPGKQVRSAIRIKNTSKSHVVFKFQTTAPKSCFMRPPGAVLAPGESIIATVFKFVEPPENNEKPTDQKSKVKFKIMSLKVKGPMEYAPEMSSSIKTHLFHDETLPSFFWRLQWSPDGSFLLAPAGVQRYSSASEMGNTAYIISRKDPSRYVSF